MSPAAELTEPVWKVFKPGEEKAHALPLAMIEAPAVYDEEEALSLAYSALHNVAHEAVFLNIFGVPWAAVIDNVPWTGEMSILRSIATNVQPVFKEKADGGTLSTIVCAHMNHGPGDNTSMDGTRTFNMLLVSARKLAMVQVVVPSRHHDLEENPIKAILDLDEEVAKGTPMESDLPVLREIQEIISRG